MTSVKIKFRPSTVEGKDGVLYFQVIQDRVVRQLNTRKHISEKEWDYRTATVRIPDNCDVKRRAYLRAVKRYIETCMECFEKVSEMSRDFMPECTVDDIIAEYRSRMDGITVFKFMARLVSRFRQNRKMRTAEAYSSTLNSLKRFRRETDLLFKEITPGMLREYQLYLTRMGVSMNTVSFYMRILRAVYNRAVEMYMVEQRFPFKNVYTGIERTVKRAVSLEDIRCIKSVDLSFSPTLDFARDMFLFSFYTRGMSFIDMAYLMKSDLSDGILTYRRHKTGQKLLIKWEACMREIVEKYSVAGSPYMLPIIKNVNDETRMQYLRELVLANRRLKKVAALVDLHIPLTMYVARHSWASIARSECVPVSVISDAMGHDSEMTTRIYLATLDSGVIDRANEMILNRI